MPQSKLIAVFSEKARILQADPSVDFIIDPETSLPEPVTAFFNANNTAGLDGYIKRFDHSSDNPPSPVLVHPSYSKRYKIWVGETMVTRADLQAYAIHHLRETKSSITQPVYQPPQVATPQPVPKFRVAGHGGPGSDFQ